MTTTLLLPTVLLWALQGQTAPDREADMFGGEDPAPPAADAGADAPPAEGPPSTSDAAGRDEAIFGGPATPSPSVQNPVVGLLEEAEKFTQVGGTLFPRLNSSLREGMALQTATLTAPSLIDAFADVRPNDRLRGFAQLRFTYDPTVTPGQTNPLTGVEQKAFDLLLDQAWMKFDLGRVVFVTAGKQRIRWGTGRFWNPTDFINTDIRNSVDFFDQRVGVNLLKLHFPFEALGWNLYLIGTFDRVTTLEGAGVAGRAEFVFGEAELAVSSLVKKDAPLRFGADMSAGVWLFDVRAEGTLQRGLGRRLFEGDLDFTEGVFPTEVDTDDEWYFQGVLGADISLKYSDVDNVVFGGEYFFNQAGYKNADLYPWLFINNAFAPLYTGQHYAAVFAAAAGPRAWNLQDLSLTLSTLGNLSDLSFLTRVDFQVRILQYLTWNVFTTVHYGNVGEFHIGIDIPPVPAIPPLAEGFTLENEMIDVGTALRMVF